MKRMIERGNDAIKNDTPTDQIGIDDIELIDFRQQKDRVYFAPERHLTS